MKIYAVELPSVVFLHPLLPGRCSSGTKAIPWAALLSLVCESWSLELFMLHLRMTL